MSDSTPLRADTLSVRSVSKSFPGTHALIDVDLEIQRGEVHALVGQNGSGKSTFIKLLAGYHTPDEGAIAHFCGAPFELGSADAAHQLGIRFVHQDLGLVQNLDAVDNLALGFGYATGSGYRIRWRAQRERARQATMRLGYPIPVGVPIERLTPSQRTAVAIARALQGFDSGASLLVLDEPTATMPRAEVVRLFETIRSVAARGVAVLYVSHHLEEIFSIADRVTVFRDGRRVATVPVADTSQTELVDLMTGGWVDAADVEAHQPASEVRLSVRGLTTDRLVDIDLDLNRGEVLGVAGITGSGREELCDAVFGGRERGGTVWVDGRELEPGRPDRSVSLGLGYVPADRHRASLAMSMSVRENLTLVDLSSFWRGGRMRRGAERAEARRWIDRLNVHTRSGETLIDSLSGGNQQKVVLGKWLRVKPAVMLLDEPTQGVDVAAKAELHALIERAAFDGTSVLVCSSDETELERLCDRVAVLRRGRIAATFNRPSINASRLVREGLQDAGVASGSAHQDTCS